MSVASEIAAYKVQVTNDVTSKTAINSITPENVGDASTDLADLIKPWLEIVEAGGGAIDGGTDEPDPGTGANGDVYYRVSGGQFYVYRKESGAWVAKVNLTLGYTLPDGPLNIRASISGVDVTVTPGSWVIGNVIYNKATTTGLTVPAFDLNFGRYDLIYANTSGVVGYLEGTAASTPNFPATPANSIVIDYVVVPSTSSGGDPYLFYAGSGSSSSGVDGGAEKTVLEITTDPFVITWSAIIPGDTITFAEKHGNYVQIQAEDSDGNLSLPPVVITRDDGDITTITINYTAIGTKIIII